MPPNLTAPGVYIEEVPSGSRSITGVSTSTAAFIGRAARGETGRAIAVNSFGDYERIFGGLWRGSDLGHVVRQFFQNGGRNAYVVRIHRGATSSQGSSVEEMVLTPTAEALAIPNFDHLRVTVIHGGAAEAYTLVIAAEDAADTVLDDGGPFSISVDLTVGVDPVPVVAAATTATTTPIPLATLSGTSPTTRPDATAAPHIEGAAGGGEARIPLPMVLTPTAEALAIPNFDHLRVTVTHGGAAEAYTLVIAAEDAADTVLVGGGPPAPFSISVDLTVGVDPVPVVAAATTATTTPIPLATLSGTSPTTRPDATAAPHIEGAAGGGEARIPLPIVLVLTPTAEALAIPNFDHLRVTVIHGGAAEAYTLVIAAEDAADTVLDDGGPFSISVDLTVGVDPVPVVAAATTATTTPIPLATLSGTSPTTRPDATAAPHIEGAAGGGEARIPLPMVLTPTAEALAIPNFDHLRVTVTHGGAAEAYTLVIAAEDAADTVLVGGGPPAPFSISVDLTVGVDPVPVVAAATTATTTPIPLATLSGTSPTTRPDATAAPHIEGAAGGGEARIPLPSPLSFRAASPGTWGDGISVTVTPDPSGGAFSISARHVDASGRETLQETFSNLVLTAGAVNEAAAVLAARSALVRLVSAPSAFTGPEVTVAFSGGRDGNEPQIADYEGGVPALDAVDVINLVCVPFPESVAVVSEANRAGFWSGTVLPWCRAHGALAIVDPPPSWSSFAAVTASLADAAGWISGLRSPFGAQYFPSLVAGDPLQQNRLRPFPPCGAVAGVIARTDGSRGVWKAPAGTDATLAGMLDVTVPLSDGEQGVLNREGINCARAWPSSGRVLWGARTLFGEDRRASEWKYLPVRRTASFLQQSLLRGTRWAVFEPNDDPLYAQIRLSIEGFLHQLFRQGAFAGQTPQEAYFVRCDRTTTTQADIDAGIVIVLIGFAPVKPAEFVVLRIQQMAGE